MKKPPADQTPHTKNKGTPNPRQARLQQALRDNLRRRKPDKNN